MTATAHAAPEVGKPAPDFSAADSNGKAVKPSDFRGKTVVLEWTYMDSRFRGNDVETVNSFGGWYQSLT